MRLANRIALITGAGRGIGRAAAVEFASQGATVVVNDVNAAAARETVEKITADGGRAVVGPADVCSEAEVNALVASVEDDVGAIDILINNAAGNPRQGLWREFRESTIDELNSWIEGSLGSALICTRAVINSMVDRGYGKVVCVSSVAAEVGARGGVGYSAGKAGLHGFISSLAKEVGPHGVNANLMMVANADSPGRTQKRIDELNQLNHLGRHGRPEEFARTLLFLASDDSSYLSGSTVVIDGGTLKFAMM
jgi:NAD(P)-dependent dehydrogenase (short-subunit alcohol dehydrogenase family)